MSGFLRLFGIPEPLTVDTLPPAAEIVPEPRQLALEAPPVVSQLSKIALRDGRRRNPYGKLYIDELETGAACALSHGTWRVWAILQAHASSKTSECWLSTDRLMRLANYSSRRGIRKSISELEGAGFIRRYPRFTEGGRQLSNGFELLDLFESMGVSFDREEPGGRGNSSTGVPRFPPRGSGGSPPHARDQPSEGTEVIEQNPQPLHLKGRRTDLRKRFTMICSRIDAAIQSDGIDEVATLLPQARDLMETLGLAYDFAWRLESVDGWLSSMGDEPETDEPETDEPPPEL